MAFGYTCLGLIGSPHPLSINLCPSPILLERMILTINDLDIYILPYLARPRMLSSIVSALRATKPSWSESNTFATQKKRMARVWEYCKGKSACEADEPRDDDAPESSENTRRHGGCGHVQPLIRKEGLKLFLVYKKIKDDDEMVISCDPIPDSGC